MSENANEESAVPAEAEEGMHLHRPKPLHGVRDISIEIGVIVVGIIIALGLETLVDQAHWSQRTHEAREQLRAETSRNAYAALEWLIVSPCLDQQLAAADAAAWQARRSGVFQPPAQRISPQLVAFSSDAWLNARSLQVADHLDAHEIYSFSAAYFYASEMAGNVTRLHEMAGELEPLTRPLAGVTPAEADDLIEKIGRFKEMQSRMELASLLLIRRAAKVDAPDPAPLVQIDVPPYRAKFGACVSDPVETERQALAPSRDETEEFRRLRLAAPDLPG